jgi:uncharacterized protein
MVARSASMAGVIAVAVSAFALYAAYAASAWAMQDSFIYHPSVARVAPTLDYVSAVEIPTPDGETLVGWRSSAVPGCPTVLFFDGNAGRPEIQEGRWRRMHDAGVGFLGLYWRGYSGSTGTPSENGFHIYAKTGLDWLEVQGVPAADIVLHGYSIGSGPATRLAAEHEVGALILEAPYYSMQDLIGQRAPFLPTGLLLRSTFRSDTWIGSVKEPVLIAHGDVDILIPQSQGKRLFEKANNPKAFISMPGSDHATLTRDGLYDRIWPFLALHWRPTSVGATPCQTLEKAAANS